MNEKEQSKEKEEKNNNCGMLKVLVSTKKTQGQREKDFCYVPEGEFVKFASVCDSDFNDPDGGCGCSQCLIGFVCLTGTTTFMVVEKNITKEQFADEYIMSEKRAGYVECEEINDEINEILKVADVFPVGSVLEYRAGVFSMRAESEC